ncbi:hypothetical protein [Roseibium sediminis]|uniref:hypothetical protein n=1 Tax=Roseibium sediminis TaxID=1775174 RepID=UPI00123E3FA0|nr:hypothetical protein [Roseibium sediminis]
MQLSPIEIWYGLHVEIESWHLKFNGISNNLNSRTDSAVLTLLSGLHDFPAERWIMIGCGAGWTPVAAAALSWCEDATWKNVLTAWKSIEDFHLESRSAKLSAQMLNPKLLPEPDLKKILELGETVGGAWVLITALKAHGRQILVNDPTLCNGLHSALQELIP